MGAVSGSNIRGKSSLLIDINPVQREAVLHTGSSLLILAGAGSGKTRVLVHRIAWLLQVEQARPWTILAVTFTNKAAREMRVRIEEILQGPVMGMWVGTFHGLAHRFLRAHWQDASLPQQFQILDADDQYRLIQWVYRRGGSEKPTRIATWEDHRKVGPLTVSLNHQGEDQNFRVWFTTVGIMMVDADNWLYAQ